MSVTRNISVQSSRANSIGICLAHRIPHSREKLTEIGMRSHEQAAGEG